MKSLKEIAAVMIATACVVGFAWLFSIKLFRQLLMGVALIAIIAGLSVLIYQWLERKED